MHLIVNWFRRYFSDPQVVVLTVLLTLAFLVLWLFSGMLLPLIISLVIAYLLDSVVLFFRRFGLPRQAGVLVVYFAFLAVFGLFVAGLGPILFAQAGRALVEVPSMISKLEQAISQLPEKYSFIDASWIDQFFTDLRNKSRAIVGDDPKRLAAITFTSIQAFLVFFIYLILIPILVFFMLKDKHRLLEWFKRFLPKERGLSVQVWSDVDRQIGNYIRGKVWEIIIVGGVSHITFTVIGLNYRALLALVVGFSVLVPYVGATLVTFPVVLVAYAQFGTESPFVWTCVAYLIIQALDGNVLVPLLFSEVVSLHPVAIIAAVLVFGGLWGFWGVFFAIPLATLVQAIIKAWPRKSRGRRRKPRDGDKGPPPPGVDGGEDDGDDEDPGEDDDEEPRTQVIRRQA